jgi:hypothetical protein
MTKIKAVEGVGLIREAIVVRDEITELYKQYRALNDTACFAAELDQKDLKRAVDAIYYLGGGWPKPSSKGRMEALLENFVGMYRILHFIDRGEMVESFLAKYGMTVTLAPEFRIENRELEANEKTFLDRTYSSKYFGLNELKTVKDLVSAIVMECQELQAQICGLADKIKDELHPAAQARLEVEDEEFDRLVALTRLTAKTSERAQNLVTTKKAAINASVSNFHQGIVALTS